MPENSVFRRPSFDHEAMVNPACDLLLNVIKDTVGKRKINAATLTRP